MATTYHTGRFPPEGLIDWVRLIPIIGPANAAVARYEARLLSIPNADILMSPLTTQEAVLSSKIEGTQATFGEVLEFEAADDTAQGEKRNDIQEILNYRSALGHATRLLKSLPLSQRLITETHKVLMNGVRGRNKAPGQYRKISNWIGAPGSTIESARFIPVDADKLSDAMSTWEKYAHANCLDRLTQLAILHAEFEAIHPFLDGNGRLGRLLVPLFLVEKKLLSGPNFYMSAYLEAHRDLYYEKLLAVSRHDDWTGWCEFFLQGIQQQAQINEDKVRQILALYQEQKPLIAELTRSHQAIQALDWFFRKPIFKTSDFITQSKIPQSTAKRIIKLTREHGMLKEIRPGKGRQSAILAFASLLNIAEGRNVF